MARSFRLVIAILCATVLAGCDAGSGEASNTDGAAAGSIDMAAAKKLLEKAVELDKKELYQAYLLFASYNVAGRPKAKAQEVIAQLDKYAASAAIPRVNEFMGHVARAGELWGDMRKYWSRVLDDPQGNKAMAQREVQFAMQKIKEAKEGDKGGLMGKLFKS